VFYCELKKKECPHLRKATRTIRPRALNSRRGICLVCSKLPRTKNIVQVVEVFDYGPITNSYHKATYSPDEK